MPTKTTLTIGEVAVRTGLTRDALRYYERLGVIAPMTRTSGGFRVYPLAVIDRLQFIKQAQLHGLTLAEIRELLRLDARPGPSQCREVQRLLERKLADLDARLIELQEFRRTLDGYLAQCNRALDETPDAACPVVTDLRRSAKGRRRSAASAPLQWPPPAVLVGRLFGDRRRRARRRCRTAGTISPLAAITRISADVRITRKIVVAPRPSRRGAWHACGVVA